MHKDDLKAFGGAALLIIGGLLLLVLIVVLVLMFWGAIFGIIGTGAYLVFKFLTGLLWIHTG